jgi:hypothetical protein
MERLQELYRDVKWVWGDCKKFEGTCHEWITLVLDQPWLIEDIRKFYYEIEDEYKRLDAILRHLQKYANHKPKIEWSGHEWNEEKDKRAFYLLPCSIAHAYMCRLQALYQRWLAWQESDELPSWNIPNIPDAFKPPKV